MIIVVVCGYSNQGNGKELWADSTNCSKSNTVESEESGSGNLYTIERQPAITGYSFNFEFSLSCIKLPETLVQANASFTLGYLIFLDKDFRPRSVYLLTFDEGIANIIKGVLDSEEVISCIKKWKFGGLNPRSTYTVLLRWEHMKGWVTMMIYSEKMNLLINLLPD